MWPEGKYATASARRFGSITSKLDDSMARFMGHCTECRDQVNAIPLLSQKKWWPGMSIRCSNGTCGVDSTPLLYRSRTTVSSDMYVVFLCVNGSMGLNLIVLRRRTIPPNNDGSSSAFATHPKSLINLHGHPQEICQPFCQPIPPFSVPKTTQRALD